MARGRYAAAAVIAATVIAASGGVALADSDATASKTTTKKVTSNVKITGFTAGATKGSVTSKTGACKKGRLVSLFHFNITTENFDLVTIQKTSPKGKFSAKATIVPGDIYAVGVGTKKRTKTKVKNGKRTVKKTICKEATSSAKQAPQDL